MLKNYDEIARNRDNLLKMTIEKSNDNNSGILNFNLDNDFYQEIIGNMPTNMTNLEKTIYVYLKMCTLLTYDEEFYASFQDDLTNKKHSDINRLSTITKINNQVICYEFNAIYAKILDKLGYKFKIVLQNENCLGYGYGHTSLMYVCDEYIVSADSVTSVLCGDLQLVKRGKLPVGINCKNESLDIIKEFNYTLEEISELIKDQRVKKDNNFMKTLDEYRSLIELSNIAPNINEKIDMFFELLLKSNLNGVDAIGYITVLANGIFNSEVKKSINNTIVTENQNGSLRPVVIFTLNNDISKYDSNLYLIFNPPNGLRQYNYEEIQKLFDDRILIFRDRVIPGIVGVNVSDVRRY